MENSRTLTSFTREVEILKVRPESSFALRVSPKLTVRLVVFRLSSQTLHHPSIIPHLTSFSTPTHHILALPFLPGGELFSIVASPELWSRVGMGWVRRVWGELEAAVGWLHSEGVVHRDVKLESTSLPPPLSRITRRRVEIDPSFNSDVLLTVPLPSHRPGQDLLPKSAFPPPPQPLINLADFGLAKRLPPPPESATLTTRCGSDSFACPEIIMGKEYDGRKADSWACGVVLFAMLVRVFCSPLLSRSSSSLVPAADPSSRLCFAPLADSLPPLRLPTHRRPYSRTALLTPLAHASHRQRRIRLASAFFHLGHPPSSVTLRTAGGIPPPDLSWARWRSGSEGRRRFAEAGSGEEAEGG